MPTGLVWILDGTNSGAYGTSHNYGGFNPESAQGAQSGNWRLCHDFNVYSFTNNTNYIDNFINFVNKFCDDCKIKF